MAYLTKRGYVLIKENFKDEELDTIRKELNINPFENPEYSFGAESKPIKVFQENSKKMYLPKMWALERFGRTAENKTPPGTDIEFNSNIKLRDYQRVASDVCLNHIQKKGGGILCLPCGRGKTITALHIAAKLGKKCLIIVHKGFLVDQWRDHIIGNVDKGVPAKFEESSVGIIKADKFDIEGKQFVIGTIQSISMKSYPLGAFDSFGTVILDEAHLVPCRVFSKALQKVNSTYMLGLTATPRRKDGTFKILKMYIGDVMYKEKAQKIHEVKVGRYILKSNDPDYCKEQISYFKTRSVVNRPKMIEQVITFLPRNRAIVRCIRDLLDGKYRKVLVLSERIAHLEFLDELFRALVKDK